MWGPKKTLWLGVGWSVLPSRDVKTPTSTSHGVWHDGSVENWSTEAWSPMRWDDHTLLVHKYDLAWFGTWDVVGCTWTLVPVEIFTYVQNKFFFSTNGRIFVFYDCLRSGLLGRIEVMSRKFSNLGIRSEYVLFAFNLRSFCIQLHSGVNQTWYIHTPYQVARDENIRILRFFPCRDVNFSI